MILNKDDKLFTIYWRGGSREVIAGKTIANAVKRAGCGGSAAVAIDWYDVGATDTHYYMCGPQTWVKRTQENIDLGRSLQQHSRHNGEIIDSMEGRSLTALKSDLVNMQGLFFELRDKSRIWIDVSIGHYMAGLWVKGIFGEESQMGWARAIRVYLAEYRHGSYVDDVEEECHYLVNETTYFDPKNIDQAIFHFQQKIKAHVNRDRGSMDLEAYRTFLTSPAAGATSIQQLLETQPIHEL